MKCVCVCAICMYLYMFVLVCMYVCVYMCIDTGIPTQAYLHTGIHTDTHIYTVNMYLSVKVYLSILKPILKYRFKDTNTHTFCKGSLSYAVDWCMYIIPCMYMLLAVKSTILYKHLCKLEYINTPDSHTHIHTHIYK